MPDPTVVIAGGGASGTLTAAALVRASEDTRVVILEPREDLGRGVAYSTDCPEHLLNVPAASLSAFSDRPDDFVRWLRASGLGPFDTRAFVARSLYGSYLNDIAAQMSVYAGSRWLHLRRTATSAVPQGEKVRVTHSGGDSILADAMVIATGNTAPAAWPAISPEVRASNRFFDSAWHPGAIVPADPNEHVLLLGTGLTAVDAVLGLRHNGHRGTMYMVSRRGLLPHEHRLFDSPPPACPDAESVEDLADCARLLAREANSSNWRAAIDRVRPRTNELWQALNLTEQRRFIRHVLPYWNVHRHRMAPDVARKLSELTSRDELRMVAGRTAGITAIGGALNVEVRLRGGGEMLIRAGRVINCSGPEHDYRKLSNPLIQQLLAEGLMAPNPLNIGVQVAPSGALIASSGEPSDRIFSIGPVRFGTLIETTAIPEIRVQAVELAARLAAIVSRQAGKPVTYSG